MKTNLPVLISLLLLFLIPSFLFSQSPQSIPYQAVVRNTDGTTMSNAALTLIFKIHDQTATGTVVYQESHSVTSNVQGLVSCNVGNGVVLQGNSEASLSQINWGCGAKFLHVLMNAGNGELDLGTQQMMSVPYALYAENVSSFISPTGDTLSIAGNSIIVPGISSENIQAQYTQGSGVTDIQGNFYPSVIINGQEWMQKNLNVIQYRNGDAIASGAVSSNWNSLDSIGLVAIYDNGWNSAYPGLVSTFGRLYNWHAVTDERGLCPSGWHVPSDLDWTYLEQSLGGSNIAGGRLKSTNMGWIVPNTGATNSSGFGALPGGYKNCSDCNSSLGKYGFYWSTTERLDFNRYSAWYRRLDNISKLSNRIYIDKTYAFSVRCLKD
jgi:uncharacterized protein (TIGR02145 family)